MTTEPAKNETCWSLVARAARDDGSSRSEFTRTYLPLIRSFLQARWRGSPLASEVDDALQDVFVECFRADGTLSRADSAQGDFRPYLFGLVRNVALRSEERARNRPRGESVLADVTSREEHLSQLFDREWAQTVMREAGDRMRASAARAGPGAQLRVELLRLRFAENLPIRTIAEQWEMDVDQLHRSFAKAREEFRSCLRVVVSRSAVRTEAAIDDECRRLFDLLG